MQRQGSVDPAILKGCTALPIINNNPILSDEPAYLEGMDEGCGVLISKHSRR